MALILLVEDDELLREACRTALDAGRHEVPAAADGAEAIDHMNAATFDPVVTDVVMPRVDGVELIGWMTDRKRHERILAISGGGPGITSDTALNCMIALGARAVLYKPFSLLELRATVDRLLAEAGSR